MKAGWFIILLLICSGLWASNDSLQARADTTLYVQADSNAAARPKNLLDSLKHPEMLRGFFFANENITGEYVPLVTHEQRRDLPRLKSIQLRAFPHDTWKFWILFLNVILFITIRLSNIKRFEEVVRLSFDLHADLRAYAEKSGNYLMIQAGLFINFILSLALFFASFLEATHQVDRPDYLLFFWQLSGFLLLLYLGKMLVHVIVGWLFQMGEVTTSVLFNTVSVNNLTGIMLLLLNLFYVLVRVSKISAYIGSVILVALLVALIYRQVRNLIMAQSAGRFPFVYVFLYFCALELAPWLVLFRLFINNW